MLPYSNRRIANGHCYSGIVAPAATRVPYCRADTAVRPYVIVCTPALRSPSHPPHPPPAAPARARAGRRSRRSRPVTTLTTSPGAAATYRGTNEPLERPFDGDRRSRARVPAEESPRARSAAGWSSRGRPGVADDAHVAPDRHAAPPAARPARVRHELVAFDQAAGTPASRLSTGRFEVLVTWVWTPSSPSLVARAPKPPPIVSR